MNNQPTAKQEKSASNRINFLDDNRIRFIVAVLLAMLTWLLVVTVIAPNSDMTIDQVPVNFAYNTAAYTDLGYSVVSEPVDVTVSLKVAGDRSAIGNLTKEDFVVYPDYSNVVTAGETSLKLLVKTLSNSASGFTVELTGITKNVRVVFDTIDTITVPIHLESTGVSIAEGYVLVGAEMSPAEVSFTGPTGELEQIHQVVAQYGTETPLNATTSLDAPLLFLDNDGNEVDFVYATASESMVEVDLTVNKYAELPITIQFINTPDHFDASVLDYSFNHETLKVSGEAQVIDALSELLVGTIDLSTFALDKVYEMPVSLPKGVLAQDNIGIIKVSFDCSQMATQTLNVSAENVVVKNLPDNYQLSVENKRIMNVVLCGPKEAIEALSADSVIATIDADDFSIALGTQTISVKVSVPSNQQVFAIGNYKVDCKIESN